MPKGESSVSGMFENLKSRLGFGGDGADDYNGGRYGNGDYDEFEEYGENYDENAVGGFRPATPVTSRGSARFTRSTDNGPRLVSIEDVKARTSIPERLNRDPLDTSSRDAGRSSFTSSRSSSAESPSTSSEESAEPAPMRSGGGVDSLFGSSAPAGSYDPYEAYSSTNPSSYTSSRSLIVVKPTVYGDVERVAKAVRSGDVIVLVMRNTPDDLSKRILDFSFGVASALEANVECPAAKVFAIARGSGLTEDEKRRLRNQGAM